MKCQAVYPRCSAVHQMPTQSRADQYNQSCSTPPHIDEHISSDIAEAASIDQDADDPGTAVVHQKSLNSDVQEYVDLSSQKDSKQPKNALDFEDQAVNQDEYSSAEIPREWERSEWNGVRTLDAESFRQLAEPEVPASMMQRRNSREIAIEVGDCEFIIQQIGEEDRTPKVVNLSRRNSREIAIEGGVCSSSPKDDSTPNMSEDFSAEHPSDATNEENIGERSADAAAKERMGDSACVTNTSTVIHSLQEQDSLDAQKTEASGTSVPVPCVTKMMRTRLKNAESSPRVPKVEPPSSVTISGTPKVLPPTLAAPRSPLATAHNGRGSRKPGVPQSVSSETLAPTKQTSNGHRMLHASTRSLNSSNSSPRNGMSNAAAFRAEFRALSPRTSPSLTDRCVPSSTPPLLSRQKSPPCNVRTMLSSTPPVPWVPRSPSLKNRCVPGSTPPVPLRPRSPCSPSSTPPVPWLPRSPSLKDRCTPSSTPPVPYLSKSPSRKNRCTPSSTPADPYLPNKPTDPRSPSLKGRCTPSSTPPVPYVPRSPSLKDRCTPSSTPPVPASQRPYPRNDRAPSLRTSRKATIATSAPVLVNSPRLHKVEEAPKEFENEALINLLCRKL